jgi:hypothetical protein
MKKPQTREQYRARRHFRVRKKVNGTAERPRLVVFRSEKHIYAQLVDDNTQHTLMTVTDGGITGKKVEKSFEVGPGLYTCQVNVVDDVGGTFAFPRIALYVRPQSPAASTQAR